MVRTSSMFSVGPPNSAACRRMPLATVITLHSGRPGISCIAPSRIPLGMSFLDSLGCCRTRARPTLDEKVLRRLILGHGRGAAWFAYITAFHDADVPRRRTEITVALVRVDQAERKAHRVALAAADDLGRRDDAFVTGFW